MAAWTQADLDAIKAAIASGTKSIQYEDKVVTYHSLKEMMDLVAIIEAELEPSGEGMCTFASFNRG
jgi:hypothetical protein